MCLELSNIFQALCPCHHIMYCLGCESLDESISFDEIIDSDSIVTRFWKQCCNGVQWENWGGDLEFCP